MSERGPVKVRSPRLPRAGVFAAGLAVLATTGVLAAVPGPPQLSASWTGWLNGGLETYADTAGQWNSGDDAAAVALPGGRSLWLLGDSYDGPVGADGTVNPYRAHYVRNMLLVTSGSGDSFRVTATVTGRVTRGVPAPAVRPAPGAPTGSWAWPAGGLVEGNAVEAVYDLFAPGPDSADVPVGSEIVTVPLASLTRPSTYTVAAGPLAGCRGGAADCVQWGVSLLDSADCPAPTGLANCTYIYGEEWPSPGSAAHRLVEAVASRGSLGAPGGWWYDTTTGWTHAAAGRSVGAGWPGKHRLAAPLGSGTAVDGISVYQVSGGSYVALSGGAAGVLAYYADSPSLEGASAATLFTAPDQPGVPGSLAYQFRVEPAYSKGPNVVMGFSVNSADHDQACMNYAPYYDVAAYQPEFYSFTLPPSAGAAVTGTLPAPRPRAFGRSPVGTERWGVGPCGGSANVPAPAGFLARYAGGGRVELTWSDPGGLYQYDIRSEDAGDRGAGWREFGYPVWDAPCPGRAGTGDCVTDTAAASFLAPGHTYRYEIAAWNWAGASDGGFSRAQASVTLPASITAATSGLCVTAPAGARLGLRGCSARSARQEWRYTPVGRDGKVTEYAIASFGSGKCLVPSGSAVSQGSCGGAAHAWEFRITDGAYDFNLYNKATGRCLAVDGNSQFAGARLGLVACDTGGRSGPAGRSVGAGWPGENGRGSTAPDAIWHSSFAY
ncbi:MAG TPA: RICIN domain-containing protein [Trebonia sp.]